MIIFGQFVSLLTFPGVIAHEFGHAFFCRRFGVKIHKVCYFRFGNPSGYVAHESPDSFVQALFIDVGPFIVNNILAVFAFTFTNRFAINTLDAKLFFIWLGVSLAMHSFPSNADAKILWRATSSYGNNILFKLIGLPFVILIYLSNVLRFFWFDLIWAGVLYYLVNLVF